MAHSKVKVTSHLKLEILLFFKRYLLRHLQWELATDHGFLNYSTLSRFDRASFLIFHVVLASRDFEVGRNVTSEESTVSPVWG